MVETIEEFISLTRTTFDLHPNLVFIKNTDMEFVYVNPTYQEVLPYLEYPILGLTDYDLFPKERADTYFTQNKKILEEQTSHQSFVNIKENDPPNNNFLLTKSPIVNDEGSTIGILGIARFANETINVQTELKENLNLIERLMNSISSPVFIKDLEGRFLQVNDAFLGSIGYESRKEVIGKTDFDLIEFDNAKFLTENDRKVIETGTQLIHISLEKTGKYLTIREPLKNSMGEITGVIGLVNNYYDLSEIQEDLTNKAKMESISQLAAGIAHDLNNILTSISGISSFLLYEAQDAEKKEQYKIIYDATKRAASLISKLQTFSQQSTVETEGIDINSEIEDVINLLKSTYQHEISFTTSFDQCIPTIKGNKSQINQMIMNLAINGIEAMMPEGTLYVSTRRVELRHITSDFIIRPDTFDSGKFVAIEVRDEGHGIEDHMIKHIFDPYYTSKETGTGLGLSIVYGVISRHNGMLRLHSTQGVGTTFEIFIPFEEKNIDQN